MTVGKQVLFGALVLALAAGGFALSRSVDDDALVLADVPTLDVTRAADGAIVIRDATRGGADSKVTVVRDGETGALVIREPGSALRSPLATVGEDGALRVPGAADAPLRVSLGAGDDTLIADCSGGAFDRGIDYAGGDGFDVLEVTGANADMAHLAKTRHDGAVVCGAMRVDYVELEPIILIGAGGFLFVDFSATTSVNVTLSDDAVPGDGVAMVVADSGAEDVIFSGFDTLTIRGGPADNQIMLDSMDTATTLTRIDVEGDDGDDTFHVDLSGSFATWLGSPFAFFNLLGEANGTAGDSLVVSGGSWLDAAHLPSNANDGQIGWTGSGGGATINYTGLEPITDLTTVADRAFIFSGASETIVLNTGGTAGDGLNFIDSTAAESVTFTAPTSSLFVACGGGDDDLTISALEGGPPVPYSVHVVGQAGNDSLTYAGPCAATIGNLVITEPGVMSVTYDTSFETVQTDPPATMTCSAARLLLWPPRGGLLPVGFSAVSGGTCASGLPITVTVYSNEPTGGLSPDALATGGALRLRAERNYPGPGRVYLVVASVNGQGIDCCTLVVPTLPVGSLIGQVRAAATAAESFCLANAGAAPAGFTQILQYTLP